MAGVKYRKFNPITKKFENTDEDQFDFSRVIGGDILMAIDGSSARTGIAFIDYVGETLLGTIAVERNAKEDYVDYKVRLKSTLKRCMDKHIKVLKRIFYEEPFVGFVSATKVLMTIRTTVSEIKLENSPIYNDIKYAEVSNTKWKKIFLYPNKVPSDSKLQKLAVQEKVDVIFGSMVKDGTDGGHRIFTEDECDAIGLGIACLKTLKQGFDEQELISKMKPRPFKYNIQFLVATADDQSEAELRGAEAFFDYSPTWKIPQSVIDNGISILTLNGRGLFDKQIFEAMGQDDKVLLVSFKGGKYVNVIIENKRTELCREYDDNEYIIAFVWRVSRKR